MKAHNCERYVKHAISSLAKQENKNWQLIFIDDASTDKTMVRLNTYLRKYHLKERTQILSNPLKLGTTFSILRACEKLPPKQVVMVLDADEELVDEKALKHLAAIFSDENVWIAYGTHVGPLEHSQTGCNHHPAYRFAERTIQERNMRALPWHSYNVKAFRAGLFRAIKRTDLEWQGHYIVPRLDAAYMLPMLEMAGFDHIRYTDHPLVHYHGNRSSKEWHQMGAQQSTIFAQIQLQTPYEPIKELP